AALARTADLLRDDADALDDAARAAYAQLGEPPWPVRGLATLSPAVRRRVWRELALRAGSPSGALTAEHLRAVDALVTNWRGQGPIDLPGGLRVHRRGDLITPLPTTA
ncbi:MAG TPA: TilS substrate-binding domain-containing protein, partial [Ornithinicoccus sp.]|nr:TilS substrate-binding domain-containing protein [Ornithinicoccus sp.]